jgi:predicted DCC family thiol-disulfide oxidoreductase YuxK
VGPAEVFFDGACGLCHFAVRFLMARDKTGTRFRYAPLGGLTFEQTLTASQRNGLPDSLVIHTPDGRVLLRSRAARYALSRLGGLWSVISALLRVVPVPLLDLAYDGVARVRRRLFAQPTTACPVVPEALRSRLDP